MRLAILITSCLLLAAGANAQDEDPERAFADAWQQYAEAKRAVAESKKPRLKTELVAAAKNVLEAGEQAFAANDERLPLLMLNYGKALLDSGDRTSAREVVGRSVDLTRELHGADSEKMIPMLMSYADSKAEFRNSSVQQKHYRQALRIATKHYGKDSVEYADLLLRAGVQVLERTKTDSGKRYFREAREIYVQRLGDESRQAGMASFYLGKSELAFRNFRIATQHFLNALDGFEGEDALDTQLEMITHAFLVQTYESRGLSDEATEHCLAIGANSMTSPDQDYQPLFRKAPKYPSDMLSRRKEGYVDVRFTVDASGFVRNPVVLYRTDKSFDKATIDAVERFRYAPRFEDGEPVAVADVKTRITFKIEK